MSPVGQRQWGWKNTVLLRPRSLQQWRHSAHLLRSHYAAWFPCNISLGRRAHPLRRRNRRGFLRYRGHQEPLVSDDVVAIGIWNLLYRHVRCRAGFLGGFRLEGTIQYFCGLSLEIGGAHG